MDRAGTTMARGTVIIPFDLALSAQISIQDMNRFASPILRVAFDGVDPPEETLYHTFRVFPLSIRNNTHLIPTTSHLAA